MCISLQQHIRSYWHVEIHVATSCLLDVICAMVKSRYIGDGHPTFNDGILIMGPYKPLRTWVDEFIPHYMERMGVDRPWHILTDPSFALAHEPQVFEPPTTTATESCPEPEARSWLNLINHCPADLRRNVYLINL